jgi:hypothetical protein
MPGFFISSRKTVVIRFTKDDPPVWPASVATEPAANPLAAPAAAFPNSLRDSFFIAFSTVEVPLPYLIT